MVGPQLNALFTNITLVLAGPWKEGGWNTGDIVGDHEDLFENPEFDALKRAHNHIPGWDKFKRNGRGQYIVDLLNRNREHNEEEEFDHQDEDDVLVPVLRWKVDSEGKRKIVLDPMPDALRQAIVQAVPDHAIEPERLESTMGAVVLAAFSPETSQWPEKDGPDAENTNFIGPTQMMAYAYMKLEQAQNNPDQVPPEQDIQTSLLLEEFEQYVLTGELPKLRAEQVIFFPPEPGISVNDKPIDDQEREQNSGVQERTSFSKGK